MEIWVPIKGFEGLYEISNKGNVKSLPREWIANCNSHRKHGEIILKPCMGKGINEYAKVTLYKDGTKVKARIHKLVAEHFLPPKPSFKHVLDHINGIRTDNRAENLRWVTQFENACCNPNTPTTDNRPILQLDLEGCVVKEFISVNQAAKEMNVNQGNLTHCLSGKYKTCGGYKWKYKI